MTRHQVDMSDWPELLRRARSGDPTALGRLLDGYRGYLRLLARLQVGRRLQGKLDGSDLVQDTFLKAHCAFAEFRGTTERELVSWLRQIMARTLANEVRRYLGRQRRDVRLERQLSDELQRSASQMQSALFARQSSPSQTASRREQEVLIADALEQLPDHYREVLISRHLQGLSFPEISRRLQRSEGSVKKLWVRGLAQVRDLLADET